MTEKSDQCGSSVLKSNKINMRRKNNSLVTIQHRKQMGEDEKISMSFREQIRVINPRFIKRRHSAMFQLPTSSFNSIPQRANDYQHKHQIKQQNSEKELNRRTKIIRRNTLDIPRQRCKYDKNNQIFDRLIINPTDNNFSVPDNKFFINKMRQQNQTSKSNKSDLYGKKCEKDQFNNYDQVAQHYNDLQKTLEEKPCLSHSKHNNVKKLYERFVSWKLNQKLKQQNLTKMGLVNKQSNFHSQQKLSSRQKINRNFAKRKKCANQLKDFVGQINTQYGKLLYY